VSPYQNAGGAYQAQAVETAGPVQLVIMLYDGAVAAIARAEHALQGHSGDKFEVANRELTRAQDIVTELWLSLDHDQGGVIAANLASIYQHCLARLTRANLDKSPIHLPEVKSHLVELRDAFAGAAAQVAAGAA
jgi:flagellar protein FliS